MIVKATLLCLLGVAVSSKHVEIKKNDNPPLGWHFEYTVEGTKRFESTGYTSHIKFWRSMDLFARIDVNEEITRVYNRNGFGARYEMRHGHDRSNTICCIEQGTIENQVRLVRWLPYFPDFEPLGYEMVKGVNCVKFIEKTNNKDKNTLWAFFNKRYWVPIRYRMRVTDSNNFNDHVIYDYFKFEPKVDMEVFDVYKTNQCTHRNSRKAENDELAKKISNEVFDEDHESLVSDAIHRHSGYDITLHKMSRAENKDEGHQRSRRDTSRSETIKDDNLPPLEWPEKYNVEATKLYLTSGWTEKLKYWQSTSMSRLDAGAVTKISKPNDDEYGLEYEIHPETTEDETNYKVCYKYIGNTEYVVEPIEFLPSTEDFEQVGSEVLRGRQCLKFTNSIEVEDKIYKNELWAYFDESIKSWVPVRYESRTSDTRHGYLKDHEIYDYYNFHPHVNNKDFKVSKKYKCIEVTPSEDDEKVKANIDRLKYLKGDEKKELDKAFAIFKQQFNKQYAHDAEHEMRKSIFYKKWRLVTETNQQNLSYKLSLNKMSDRTEEELKRYRGLRRDKQRPAGNLQFPYSHKEIKKISETLPSEYDLRLEGVVGPVLDQEYCGSCWTFGTTAAVEGALARSNGGTLITLSNQALLDCSWGMGNGGCDGGTDTAAYKWIMKHGLPTVEEYGPYIQEEGYCNIQNMTNTYKIRGWVNVTSLSEEALKVALIKHGPLSVSIHATDTFSHYDGGILYDTECSNKPDDLNHEMTLVGYGEKDGDSFWIVKNSHGPYWGLNGYLHISTRNNNCGIMTEPTYVVMK